MAQAPIPDKMRPALTLLAKHHFWLLAVVLPAVLLPLLFMARGQLAGHIGTVRNQIKGHIDALQGIRKISQHPNAAWKTDIDASTARVRKETLAEWQRFWDSQKPFRTWPESLGADFVKAADELKPDGKLSRKLLERYQNNVRSLVRELPERMGAEQQMGETEQGGQAGAGMPRPPAAPPGGFPPGGFPGGFQPGGFQPGGLQPGGDAQASRYFFIWNAENQARIYSSFNWDKAPTTARVLLAQEELRVYGMFCDTIARINKPGTGPHNVPIISVDELLVGYPAAEENPGGVLGGRITRPAQAVPAGGMPMDPMMGMGGMGGMPPDMMQAGGAAGPGPGPRPTNPRFILKDSGAMASMMPPPGEGGGEAAAAVSPDEMLRNWIYVDFTGRPLDATQLAAAPDAQMVHLMPFVMRLVIDQRQIDKLLVDLATSPLPIDVRQVRINPGAPGTVSGGLTPPATNAPGAAHGRTYDVTLELRGTVGLATPPNQKAVGLETAEPGASSGDSAPAARWRTGHAVVEQTSGLAEDGNMKAPRVAFNKDSLLSFFVNHGEKVVAALLGLFACTLAWGGMQALRTLRPTDDQRPETITKQADDSATHIQAVKIAPDDELTSEKGLAAIVERWRAPKVVPAPTQVILDKPLFAELARRSSPTILPVEDLRAVSGVVIVAEKPPLAAGGRAAADRPLDLDGRNAAKQAKPARPGGRGGATPDPVPQPGDLGMMPPGSDPSQQLRGRIMPYVLVTGLIPVAKQQEEYSRRFETASLRDVNLDTPRWNSYRIERTEVIPGAAEKWTTIDLKATAKRYSAEWSGLQAEALLPPILQLAPEQERRDPAATPIPFCSPLPQLTDGIWGFNAVHPWIADYVQKKMDEERKSQEKLVRENASKDVFSNPNGQQPGMMPDSMMPGMLPGMMPPGGMMPGMEGQMVAGVEYRLFRFIDTTVQPGRSYRYRVKVLCWNPNLNVPNRHLVDASLAKQPTLESAPSGATSPVIVPDGRRMLVQPLKKPELKRLKQGQVAVSLLGEKPQGGAFALRGLIMEVGGLANVEPQTNKKGDPRSRGDELVTDRVLLDVRGRIEDRTETRTGRPTTAARAARDALPAS